MEGGMGRKWGREVKEVVIKDEIKEKGRRVKM